MNSDILKQYCKQYQWADLLNSIEKLEEAPEVRVGFLGEFSSGKSTLINGLLHSDLLPTGDLTTTKRITEIRFSRENTQPRFFLRDEPGAELTIEQFKGQAKISDPDAATLVTHPPRGLLRPGFSLIDTPGLASLDAMDEDITFGFLPFLDGAVICIDCVTGSLGKSVIEFLNKPEVHPLIEYFLFALTKADLKAPTAQEKIRQHIIETLQEQVYFEHPESVPHRVVLTSIPDEANPALEEDSAFFTAYTAIFTSRVQTMHARRRERELEKVREEMLIRLETLKATVNQNIPDISAQQKELAAQKEALREEQRNEERRLEDLKEEIEASVKDLIQSYRNRVAHASVTDLPKLCESVPADLNNLLTSHLQNHFKSFSDVSWRTGPMTDALKESMNKLTEPHVVQKVVDALLLGLLPVIGGPLRGGIAGIIKFAGKTIARTGISSLVANFFGSSKQKKLDAFLETIPAIISSKAKHLVNELYEKEVFQPLEKRTEDLQRNIRQIQEERENSIKDVDAQRVSIETAIKDIYNA